MHLEDFRTERREIVIWCESCWQKAERTGRLERWSKWRINRAEIEGIGWDPRPDAPLDSYVVIGYLTRTAITHRDGNCPNVVAGEDEPCETEIRP